MAAKSSSEACTRISVQVQVDSKSRTWHEIGEIARHAGVTPSCVRYYEAIGALSPPARRSGAREYDERSLARLRDVLIGRRLGFSLAEIRAMTHGTSTLPERAAERIRALDQIIRNARVARALLRVAAHRKIIAPVRYDRILAKVGM